MMKKKTKGLFLGALAVMTAICSCTSDAEVAPEGQNNIYLQNLNKYGTKSSSVNVNIGSMSGFAQTRCVDINGNMWSLLPDYPSTLEIAGIKNYIASKPASVKWPDYTYYYVQHVGGAHHNYSYKDKNGALHTNIDGTNSMEALRIQEKDGSWVYVNNFNGGKCVNLATHNCALITNGFKDAKTLNEYSSSIINQWRLFYWKGNYYLGFDFCMKKGDGVIDGDCIFDDWIIKIIPAKGEKPKTPVWDTPADDDDPNVDTPADDDAPNVDTPAGDDDPNVDTPADDDDPSIDTPADDDDPSDDTPADDDDPSVDTPADDDDPSDDTPATEDPSHGLPSVEVDIHHQNHNDWNELKTSIHLRDTVDVRVFIPVPQEMQAIADDFDIRTGIDYKTLEGGFSEVIPVKYTIASEEFIVNVQINHKADGIEMLIEGAECAKALRHARGIYDDGITFEIHSYLNPDIEASYIWNNILKNVQVPGTSLDRWPGDDSCVTLTYGQVHSAFFEDEEIKFKKEP